MTSADIHCKIEMCGARLDGPGRQLRASRLQHPVSDRQDQSSLLRERDEFVWENHSTLRMLPTHQRLGARRTTIGIYLLLVVEDELIRANCSAQVIVQRRTLGYHGLHLRIKEAQGVATGRLGLIHCQVGTLKQ